MTDNELMIYRLRLRVALLEQLCCSSLVSLLIRAGANPDQAGLLLQSLIEEGKKKIRVPFEPDPAENALAQDEFREAVERLKALVKSYR